MDKKGRLVIAFSVLICLIGFICAAVFMETSTTYFVNNEDGTSFVQFDTRSEYRAYKRSSQTLEEFIAERDLELQKIMER